MLISKNKVWAINQLSYYSCQNSVKYRLDIWTPYMNSAATGAYESQLRRNTGPCFLFQSYLQLLRINFDLHHYVTTMITADIQTFWLFSQDQVTRSCEKALLRSELNTKSVTGVRRGPTKLGAEGREKHRKKGYSRKKCVRSSRVWILQTA